VEGEDLIGDQSMCVCAVRIFALESSRAHQLLDPARLQAGQASAGRPFFEAPSAPAGFEMTHRRVAASNG
jgi:hypothetical protein